MGAPKETLGWPSRTAAVLAMRASGMSHTAIGAKIGIPAKTVSALEASARREPTEGKAPRRSNTIEFAYDLREYLRPHARRRDMPVEALALHILEVVIYGDLVDAVLDDRKAGA